MWLPSKILQSRWVLRHESLISSALSSDGKQQARSQNYCNYSSRWPANDNPNTEVIILMVLPFEHANQERQEPLMSMSIWCFPIAHFAQMHQGGGGCGAGLIFLNSLKGVTCQPMEKGPDAVSPQMLSLGTGSFLQSDENKSELFAFPAEAPARWM